MKHTYPIWTVVAGAGYLTALVLYGLTFYDVNSEELVIYWPLTFVMFGTWFAAVLKLRADTGLKELQRKDATAILYPKRRNKTICHDNG